MGAPVRSVKMECGGKERRGSFVGGAVSLSLRRSRNALAIPDATTLSPLPRPVHPFLIGLE